jgi:hypothetical protein
MSLRAQWPSILAGAIAAGLFVGCCQLLALHVEAVLATRADADFIRLSFTTPVRNAGFDGCSPGLTPLEDLDQAILMGVWQTGDTILIQSHSALAPGARDQFRIPRISQLRKVWVETIDFTGNGSCRSNVLEFGPTSSVPFDPGAAGELGRRELFDIAGRKVSLPAPAGIYFENIPNSRIRRIVVIR